MNLIQFVKIKYTLENTAISSRPEYEKSDIYKAQNKEKIPEIYLKDPGIFSPTYFPSLHIHMGYSFFIKSGYSIIGPYAYLSPQKIPFQA